MRHNSFLLLSLLLLMLALSPVFEGMHGGRFLLDVLFCLLLVSAIAATPVGRYLVLVVLVLAMGILAIRWVDVLTIGEHAMLAGYSLYLLLIVFSLACVLWEIVTAKVIDARVIVDAISAYLLIGVIWAMIFLIIHALVPDAFEFELTNRYELWTRYLYLSFMTLTTLGYGDITSSNSVVQIWSVFEAIVGVFFQAILIARLVSLYGARR